MRNIVVAITSLSDWYDVAHKAFVVWQRRMIRQCRRGLLTGGVAPVLARRSGDVQEDGWVPPVEATLSLPRLQPRCRCRVGAHAS